MKKIYYSKYLIDSDYLIEWLIENNISQKEMSVKYGNSIQRFHYLIHKKRYPLTVKAYNRVCETLFSFGIKNVKPFFSEYKKPERKL